MEQRIRSVCVAKGFNIVEGEGGVTDIIFGEECGPMSPYRTIEVWKGGQRHATFPFHQVLGIYFKED